MTRPILIVGASGRAAARMARLTGWTPTVIDLFADADTRAIAECVVCPWDDYPHGIAALAEQVPPMPFVYTGGIENHPSLIVELSKTRHLYGNGPDVLKKVRDPAAWTHLLKGYGFAVPKLVVPGSKPPRSGEWVRKPFASAGGLGVRMATSADRFSIRDPDCGFFLQEFVPGRAMSAYFESQLGSSELYGVCEQLIGEPWLHAKPFAYCGSVGRLRPTRAVDARLRQIGQALTAWAGLTDLWGIDFILRGGRTPVPLEINPRTTASAELYDGTGPTPKAKAVYYAPKRIVFPDSGPWSESLSRAADVSRMPDYADIPDPGSVIDAGRPVLTFFAMGRTADDCHRRLQQRAGRLDRLFAAGAPA